MTYILILGDYAYSSWSLRGWLLFEKFGIDRRQEYVSFGDDGTGWDAIDGYPPANTVPTLVTPEGAVVSDSLAIAEELATRHPNAGIWPADPLARATARTLAAEMHSGFGALRNDCPMNLRCAYTNYSPSADVQKDVARIETIWSHAFETFGGPWLCGPDFFAADVFFAPIAARFAGYGIGLSKDAQAYVDRHLSDDAFRRWRAMGLVKGPDLPWYAMDFDQGDWPGPRPLDAKPVEMGPSINDACPYSGKPVTDYLELGGKVYGFCNPFCRNKTIADPEAWPAFMTLVNGS